MNSSPKAAVVMLLPACPKPPSFLRLERRGRWFMRCPGVGNHEGWTDGGWPLSSAIIASLQQPSQFARYNKSWHQHLPLLPPPPPPPAVPVARSKARIHLQSRSVGAEAVETWTTHKSWMSACGDDVRHPRGHPCRPASRPFPPTGRRWWRRLARFHPPNSGTNEHVWGLPPGLWTCTARPATDRLAADLPRAVAVVDWSIATGHQPTSTS